MIDTVIFDLDGTLLNTLCDLAGSVNAALAKNNMPQRTLNEVREFVGNGVRNLMLRAVPGGSENPAFEQAFADFKEHYARHCADQTAPYPGVLELLTELNERGYKLAVVSNKLDAAVKKLAMQYFGDLLSVVASARKRMCAESRLRIQCLLQWKNLAATARTAFTSEIRMWISKRRKMPEFPAFLSLGDFGTGSFWRRMAHICTPTTLRK